MKRKCLLKRAFKVTNIISLPFLFLGLLISQELLDRLHRQARVEEEVKHALKAYYKHRDITKDEYKGILRRAVPQVRYQQIFINAINTY